MWVFKRVCDSACKRRRRRNKREKDKFTNKIHWGPVWSSAVETVQIETKSHINHFWLHSNKQVFLFLNKLNWVVRSFVCIPILKPWFWPWTFSFRPKLPLLPLPINYILIILLLNRYSFMLSSNAWIKQHFFRRGRYDLKCTRCCQLTSQFNHSVSFHSSLLRFFSWKRKMMISAILPRGNKNNKNKFRFSHTSLWGKNMETSAENTRISSFFVSVCVFSSDNSKNGMYSFVTPFVYCSCLVARSFGSLIWPRLQNDWQFIIIVKNSRQFVNGFMDQMGESTSNREAADDEDERRNGKLCEKICTFLCDLGHNSGCHSHTRAELSHSVPIIHIFPCQ